KERKRIASSFELKNFLVESDSPYIGKTPLDTFKSAELLSKYSGKSIKEIEKETTKNIKEMLKINPIKN
ncbi:MAG: hypothetical protein QXI58_07180, partial [Candidatus Micrarchaeia archaeon]